MRRRVCRKVDTTKPSLVKMPPIVQRYLHVYFKNVTGRSFAFLIDENPSEPYSEEDESSFKVHSVIVYA